jgi:hypothetical protein
VPFSGREQTRGEKIIFGFPSSSVTQFSRCVTTDSSGLKRNAIQWLRKLRQVGFWDVELNYAI